MLKNSNQKTHAFNLLKSSNLSEETHQELYNLLATKEYYCENLAKGFILLSQAGLSYQDHKNLYISLYKNTYHAIILANGYILLNTAQIKTDEYPDLYLALQERAYYAKKLALAFVILHKNNINIYENKEIHKAIMKEQNHPDRLAYGLCHLKENDFPEEVFLEFLALLLKNQDCAHTLAPFLALAHKANFNHKTYPHLYDASIQRSTIRDKLTPILELLTKIGITFSDKNEEPFNDVFLLVNNSLSCYVFEILLKSGYTFKNHKSIIKQFISILSSNDVNQTRLMNTLTRIEDYSNSNVLLNIGVEGYDIQTKKLEDCFNQNICLSEGPLNKSAATTEIERLLTIIAKSDISLISIRYNLLGQYILQIPNERKTNLSILIKNANLTQISLNLFTDNEGNNLIESLGNILSSFVPYHWDKIMSYNPVVNLLPPTQQKAITLYTTEFYLYINQLFRGEPMRFSSVPALSTQSHGKNYLMFFILGCLLNDAINKFPHIISEERKKNSAIENYLIQKNSPLDRGEFLYPHTIEARLKNPWSFPALTSFSARINGEKIFHRDGTTRTTLENSPQMPIINIDENEILFSHGTTILSSKLFNGLSAMIVNSPLLERPDYRWSDEALTYAYKHYLSKKYLNAFSEITIKKHRVFRPNHNLGHVYRGMNAIPIVLNYFKEHAKDPEFKEFCNSISATNIEWLRVAAAFRVTGRESEISALEDFKTYDQYRQASAKHFKEYVKKTKDILKPDINAMLERMSHVVRYMGNPYYEECTEPHSPLYCIEDEFERKIRIFYQRILSIAHALDLARCYGANQFLEKMQPCLNLSNINSLQQKDFNEMISYSIELIKTHGSTLYCEMKSDGSVTDVTCSYKDIFAKTSTSLKALYEITECVTRPSRPTM